MRDKWELVPNELQKVLPHAVILINGLLVYRDYLSILYGWNIPEKAKRSWDLIDTSGLSSLSPMCMTSSCDLAKKLNDIWDIWNSEGTEDWATIYNKNKFVKELEKHKIKWYSYSEPLILNKKN